MFYNSLHTCVGINWDLFRFANHEMQQGGESIQLSINHASCIGCDFRLVRNRLLVQGRQEVCMCAPYMYVDQTTRHFNSTCMLSDTLTQTTHTQIPTLHSTNALWWRHSHQWSRHLP
jgi:hypothetical protein